MVNRSSLYKHSGRLGYLLHQSNTFCDRVEPAKHFVFFQNLASELTPYSFKSLTKLIQICIIIDLHFIYPQKGITIASIMLMKNTKKIKAKTPELKLN